MDCGGFGVFVVCGRRRAFVFGRACNWRFQGEIVGDYAGRQEPLVVWHRLGEPENSLDLDC